MSLWNLIHFLLIMWFLTNDSLENPKLLKLVFLWGITSCPLFLECLMTFSFLMLHQAQAATLYTVWLHFYPLISSEDCHRTAMSKTLPDFLGCVVKWKAIECLRNLSGVLEFSITLLGLHSELYVLMF